MHNGVKCYWLEGENLVGWRSGSGLSGGVIDGLVGDGDLLDEREGGEGEGGYTTRDEDVEGDVLWFVLLSEVSMGDFSCNFGVALCN